MRKTKEDAARTRDALLTGALECFDRKGIAGSTIDDIAEAAGVTKGALYWHFKGKGEMLQELRAAVALPILDRLDTTLLHEGEADPLDRLEIYLLSILDGLEQDAFMRKSLGVMHFKCEYVGELERELESARINTGKLSVAFEKVYTEAKRKGLLADDVMPRSAAVESMMFFAGFLRMWLLEPEERCFRKEARNAIRTHVRAKRK